MSDPRTILERTRTIAVVGLSTDPAKASHAVAVDLQRAGYRIIPIHPSAERLLGEPAFKSLADVRLPIDLVDVFRPPGECPAIAEQAVAAGAKALWLQLGIVSAEARAIAERGGVDYVEDRCAKVERRRHNITAPAGPGTPSD